MNAYSVTYSNPVADGNGVHHQILYFGMERIRARSPSG